MDTKMKDSTLSYYNSNASEYAETVNRADMSAEYNRFLKYVPTSGSIVDIGCGSGRDLKYFKDLGYKAVGIDASEKLCEIARKYSGCKVECCDFLTWNPPEVYDAFWANASLLHLKENEILEFFASKTKFLKEGGVVFFSMKSGIYEGYDSNGRYFTPFSEFLLEEIIKQSGLSLTKRTKRKDCLSRKDFIWEIVVLRKN